MEMDWFFYRDRVEYYRYSDDILIMANSEEELKCHITKVKQFLSEMNLEVNTEKEVYTLPGQRWDFPVINTDQTLKQIDSYVLQR